MSITIENDYNPAMNMTFNNDKMIIPYKKKVNTENQSWLVKDFGLTQDEIATYNGTNIHKIDHIASNRMNVSR